jgi:hypothetical protein
MGERLLNLVNLIDNELQIIRDKDAKIDEIISQLENLREIINDLGDQNSQNRARKITLSISDILYGQVPEVDLGKVIEVNLSGENRYEASSISENDIVTILKFFQNNELSNLETLRINDISNANEILKRIFASTETKKTLYSLSEISAINSKGEELSKDTIECIFNHFNDYPYLIRTEPINGCYRTKQGIQEELVAPLNVNMSTSGMGTYLPWFMGDYRDGMRVSTDKRFKCYYRNRWDAHVDIPLYIKIHVST